MTDNLDSHAASLELNARGHHHNPDLEHAADLMASDRAAFMRLPSSVQSQAATYYDMREHHRAAVAAGVIKDTPNAN